MSVFPTKRGSTAALRALVPHDRVWRLVDAENQVLGRVAVQIAKLLQGKHKPYYMDNIFSGDPVVVINARHIALTGRKSTNKVYYRHSGYPGGLKQTPITRLLDRQPTEPLRRAVYNMLPRNKLRSVWLQNLHIYPDAQHSHIPQKPRLLPPATICKRLGQGGPPLTSELQHFWAHNLTKFTDQDLNHIFSSVREHALQYANQSTGLAQLLQPDHQSLPPRQHTALTAYIQAAEAHLSQPAVYVPTLPH